MFWGSNENLLSGLVLGAEGGVGSTCNYAVPLCHRLIEAYGEGDLNEAREYQKMAVSMINLLNKYCVISVGKAFMKYIGIDCDELRLPVNNDWKSVYEEFKKTSESSTWMKCFQKSENEGKLKHQ